MNDCDALTVLPAGLEQLGALKQLSLGGLLKLQAMPDASGLTSLEILEIDDCDAWPSQRAAELQAPGFRV